MFCQYRFIEVEMPPRTGFYRERFDLLERPFSVGFRMREQCLNLLSQRRRVAHRKPPGSVADQRRKAGAVAHHGRKSTGKGLSRRPRESLVLRRLDVEIGSGEQAGNVRNLPEKPNPFGDLKLMAQ